MLPRFWLNTETKAPTDLQKEQEISVPSKELGETRSSVRSDNRPQREGALGPQVIAWTLFLWFEREDTP